jgi:hypothetical protein
MHLNRLQHIGVVASVMWAIGGACWGFNIGHQKRVDVLRDYELCRDRADFLYRNTPGYTTSDWARDRKQCDFINVKKLERPASVRWLNAALVGLLPIPLGWLAAPKFMALVRWIRA